MRAAIHARRFRAALLRWYRKNRRDLPWRRTRDPYRIWLSEVMLQQTRVAVVLERYPEFLRRFPSLRKLARARLSAVLAVWSGLGYYRRARALHRAARLIVSKQRGRLPKSAEALRTLPGVGRYTSAAVASIAFGEPVAVVDGNVERVLSRLYGAVQPDPWVRAADLLDRNHPGDFNQAMMELGATVCLPHQPLCAKCPVHAFCVVRGKLAAQQKSERRKQQVSYGLMRKNGGVYLVQRSRQASLMAEMWELPELQVVPDQEPVLTLRHAITNTDYEVSVFATRAVTKHARGRWVPLSSSGRLPLTGLTRKVLRQL